MPCLFSELYQKAVLLGRGFKPEILVKYALIVPRLQLMTNTQIQLNTTGDRINSSLPLTPSSEIIDALRAGSASDLQGLHKLDLGGVELQTANLSQASLIGVNFSGANLSEVNFSGTDLRGVNFSAANLQGANLQGAYLSRANLRQANLTGANLDGAKLQVASYDLQTIWPEGYAYKKSGAVGPGAILNGAYLNTANLKNADLQGANLLGAYLSGADMTGANLENACLSGADLRVAFLTGAYLYNARFNGADLQGADFRAADMTGVEIEHIQSIAGADFTMVQGLSQETRARLCARPSQELDIWNSYTRRTTRESLVVGVME
ncbi:pentapeptide repeat-containing protein [Calothrix rhizosoleniae]|uniref:pentapeptide repeat-containing protein n=1 Tax=Calothrix rhizosoleniae TaxID=888997 RepID=UPI001F16D2E4|nr:pentapeptide repeat-containing protein [Calothrix rhizosoleniae]